ncbi:MAG: hypothetical protein P8L77_05200 [Gammaproteobacteria bacterium]|nr:hypothetical protein [Gammaproteobacteria bacterium]
MAKFFGNTISDQNLSSMFEVNSDIIQDDTFKSALGILERAYINHTDSFENEPSKRKLEDFLRSFYLKSLLYSDDEYIKSTGEVLFSTYFNMCLNLLISSLILSATGSFPIALIAFIAISYKLILNSITKNNVIHKQYLDVYEIKIQDQEPNKHSEFEIYTSYSDQSISDRTYSEGGSSYGPSSPLLTPNPYSTPERKPRGSCDTPNSDRSCYTDRESSSLFYDEEYESPGESPRPFY